ncbi:unnamed protein product [Protopolystoma xenopodis]|uniref:Uncharacterized protein n=1 Tax=Protopolystoma xenopodis TaxID=117903 RepID=A0A3S5AVY6_9PLAT|nr:unnamed protein product [Protopolystoma xenopodis]
MDNDNLNYLQYYLIPFSFKIRVDMVLRKLGLVESSWRFTVIALGLDPALTVPFLIVGQAREPQVLFETSHLNIKGVLVGHTIRKTVNLMNLESGDANKRLPITDETKPQGLSAKQDDSLKFSFVEASCFSAGQLDRVHVEPIEGRVDPGSK